MQQAKGVIMTVTNLCNYFNETNFLQTMKIFNNICGKSVENLSCLGGECTGMMPMKA